MKEFFDAIAGRYDREYALAGDESRVRIERVLRELAPASRVLDLGVGTGRELSALLDAGHTPTGVDVSGAMLDRCARRARPVALVRADFWCALPFGDGSFDAAIALHGTLAHPPDEGAVARLAIEVARVVSMRGTFVAEVPAPAWLDRVESMPASHDRRARRTGPRTCVYEDLVAGVSIEARVLSADEWRSALAPRWNARVEPLGEVEHLVAARRA